MILKSYIVEQDVEILKNYKATLIYGENNGIKNDVKQKIKDNNDVAEILNFFEADILKNNSLYDNVSNQSLFSEKKIIFVQEASDKVFDQIEESIEKENNDIKIYIFADILEKKSKLRNLFEKDSKLAIFPCYEDNERTLITYINREMQDFKGLTGEIINLIIYNSNLDRRVIKSEINKIKNFFLSKKINKEEILEILNIKNDSGFDEIRDKALVGEKTKVNKLLSETEILNEEAFFYLNILNYRILRLHQILKMNQDDNNYEKILKDLKPPIFWKDNPIIIQQLKKWNKKKIEEIIIKIGETEILMKKNSQLRNDVIIKDLIINLTNKASTTS
jgi:DNA polymerase-3 subunit delta